MSTIAVTSCWPEVGWLAMSAPMPEPAPASDESLVRDTLAGDGDAFAELVRRHKRRVLATASRFAADPTQMDDLAQEVFLRAYKRLGQFRGDAPFEHWLARLTVTACYDFLRRERRHRANLELDSLEIQILDDHTDAAASARQAQEILARAMTQLNPEERLVITLFELEDKDIHQVSALTGWSVGNVKVRAFRARQRLKTILRLDT